MQTFPAGGHLYPCRAPRGAVKADPIAPHPYHVHPEISRKCTPLSELFCLLCRWCSSSSYNLAISSEFRPAKGVIARADTMHICYCHSPMRYLWDFYQDYLESTAPLTGLLMRSLFRRLRLCSFLLPSGLTTSSPISIRYSSGLDGGGGKK